MGLVPCGFSLPVSPFRPVCGEFRQNKIGDGLTVIGEDSFVFLGIIFLKKRRQVAPQVVTSPDYEFAEEIVSPVGLT